MQINVHFLQTERDLDVAAAGCIAPDRRLSGCLTDWVAKLQYLRYHLDNYSGVISRPPITL